MAIKPKQINFCRKYIENGGNVSQAMQDVGYSKNYAEKMGYKFINKPEIQDYLHKLKNDAIANSPPNSIMTPQEVLQYWTWAVRQDIECGQPSKPGIEASKMLSKIHRMEQAEDDTGDVEIIVRIEGEEYEED